MEWALSNIIGLFLPWVVITSLHFEQYHVECKKFKRYGNLARTFG